jgi:hypothetical protein
MEQPVRRISPNSAGFVLIIIAALIWLIRSILPGRGTAASLTSFAGVLARGIGAG